MTKNGNSAKIPKRLPKIPKMRKTPTLFKKTAITKENGKNKKITKRCDKFENYQKIPKIKIIK